MTKRKFAKTAGSLLISATLILGLGIGLHTLTEESLADGTQEKILAKIEHQFQRKDTKLLCLDGCSSDLDGSDKGKGRHWDSEQSGLLGGISHGSGNCARAVISMMVSFYGKRLSQDRIAFYMEEERPSAGDNLPEGDLAHNKGMQYSEDTGGDETIALEWALNEKIRFINGAPEFEDIKRWLNEDRPIMIRRTNYVKLPENHISLIAGYRIKPDGKEQIFILDPLVSPQADYYKGWRPYPIPLPMSDKNQIIQGVWVGPVNAPNARQDEESIGMDSDGDGIMDFDEQKRFFTDPHKKDSDNDGVSDKNDIREYVFDAQDQYAKRDADLDKDGLRKELDPDNDNDLAMDGCEDSNQNGKYETDLEVKETDNFNPEERLAMCVGQPDHRITNISKPGKTVHPTSAPVQNLEKPKSE